MAPLPCCPSPKFQAYEAIVPSESVDVEPLKLTSSGADPVEGVAVMRATGG